MPLVQVTNFGYFSSKSVQNWAIFVEKGKFKKFGASLLKLKATNDFLSQFWSRWAFDKLDILFNSENGFLLEILTFSG